MIVNILVKNQTMYFQDFRNVTYYKAPISLSLNIQFPKEWDSLEKWISFSTSITKIEFKDYKLDGVFNVPEEYIHSPGIAFYCYGVDKVNKDSYCLPTNFLKIFIKEEM
jgi:hypothetical protein